MTEKKEGYWASIFAPSVFDLSDYDQRLRGRGTIWFLADHANNPVVNRGELGVVGGSICESAIIETVREVIHHECKAVIISAIEALQHTADEAGNIEVWDALCQDLEYCKSQFDGDPEDFIGSDYEFDELGFDTLAASGDLNWALETVHSARTSFDQWSDRPEEIEKLLSGDFHEIAVFWNAHGCGRPSKSPTAVSSYDLALFGIEAPGGFQSWNAVRGEAQRHSWIPEDMPLNVVIDAYGALSPEPSASRLFVPQERGAAVRSAVTLAFLRHAKSLVNEHDRSTEWLEWFAAFLRSWEGRPFALSPAHVREYVKELDGEPGLADVPNGLWAGVAATHSEFGRLVMSRNAANVSILIPIGFMDVTQPIGCDLIEWAAAEAGIASDKIDATVESLSEFLGWDITKGLGAESSH